MYKQQNNKLNHGKLTCPECKSNYFRVSYGKVECTNCGWKESANLKTNKYGAKRTVARDGIKRDSKFEAGVADQLRLRKLAGDIKDYDSQFKVEMWICNEEGERKIKVTHKVDFRIHHNDESYELVEAKGVETSDYKWRRRLLEELWLPQHKDHIYTVVKQRKGRR